MNINNIKQLFHRYFAENGKKDMVTLLVVFILSLFFSYFAMGFLAFTVACILVLSYTGGIFNRLGSNSYGIHYLTLPSSPYEKLTVQSILALLYYPIANYAVYFLGSLAGFSLRTLVKDYYFSWASFIQEFSRINNIETILIIFFILSLLMFGSIYFKRHSLFLTLSIIGGFCLGILIIDSCLVLAFAEHHQITDFHLDIDEIFYKNFATIMEYSLLILGIGYFWVLSLIRLKETEA